MCVDISNYVAVLHSHIGHTQTYKTATELDYVI